MSIYKVACRRVRDGARKRDPFPTSLLPESDTTSLDIDGADRVRSTEVPL